jgi:hypothetical protein
MTKKWRFEKPGVITEWGRFFMQSPLMLLQMKLADYQKKAAELRTIDEFILLKQTLQEMMKVFAACEEWDLYQKTADLMAQTVLRIRFIE